MGGSCSPCGDRVEVAKTAADAPYPPQRSSRDSRSPRSPRTRKNSKSSPRREGQRRTDLHIKEGGFALKNFFVTNTGKVEDYFNVEKQKIGEGGFGAVRRAQDKRTKVVCALKTIRKSAKDEVTRLKEEIEIMRILDHPNIIRFLESFEDKRYIYIALELCEGGELFQRICAAGKFSERIAAGCVRQMLLAINYLHQNYIMHRDLKPENWLLASREDVAKAPLKLIDFGISKRFQPGDPAKTKAGTPNYVAPEVLGGRYDEKVDIWSLGVITFVMLAGRHPFSGKTVDQVLKNVKTANYNMDADAWKKISNDGKGLVKACLQKNMTLRLSAQMALQHAWFKAEVVDGLSDLKNLELTGLKAFGRMHQMKKAVLTVMATQLSNSKIQALKSMFMAMDRNSDGTLAISEIKEGLAQVGVDLPPNLDALLQEVDTDGSGVVDYTEFLAATMDKKLYRQEDVVWQAFKKFDLDGSGAIDKKELAKVLGESEVMEAMNLEGEGDRLLEVFNRVDANGDGMIDFQEFFAMMRAAEEEKSENQETRQSARRRMTAPAGPKKVERMDIGIAGSHSKSQDMEASPLVSQSKFSAIF